MKILMVCTNPVLKHKEGGSKLAIEQVAELCSSPNKKVIFLTAMSPKDADYLPNNGTDSGDTYYFRQWMFWGEYLHIFTDFNISFLRKLRQVVRKENIDLILVTMPYGIVSASIVCRRLPIIYDSHAVTSDTVGITLAALERHPRISRVPITKQIARLILRVYIPLIERITCKRAAHIKAIGEPDKQRFMEKYGLAGDKITVIPPYISSPEFDQALPKKSRGKEAEATRVVFHGAYTYSSNREAFELILNYIAPEVGKRSSKIQFLLAGVGVPVFEAGNVRALGFVKDIRTFLLNSDIALVPHMMSGGIRTKVFDYMIAGLPIVATKGGMQNIEAEDGKQAIICDRVDQKFIDGILALADDPKRREVLGRNAWELAKVKYSQETMQARMDEMLAKVMESKRLPNA